MRIVKTFIGAFLTVFVVLTIVFFMVRLAPGGPFDSEKALSAETRAELQKTYGLDRPMAEQYWRFLSNFSHGELGVSLVMEGQSVGSTITRAFPVSLGLGIGALAIAVIGGIPLGFLWACRDAHPQPLPRGGVIIGEAGDPLAPPQAERGAGVEPHKSIPSRDCAGGGRGWATSKALFLFTMLPSFVAAPIAQQLVLLCGGAAYGYTGVQSLFWPSLVLGLYYLPFVARLTQVGFQEEKRALYLRVAQAKGLSRVKALWLHGYKAALGPVLAYLGPTAAGLVTGAFVVETVWGLPGLGRFFVNAVFNRDDTLLLGLVAFYTVVLVGFNTVIEIILTRWNPAGKGEEK